MSTRVVKLASTDQAMPQSLRAEESSDDDEEDGPTRNPAQNFFDLLGSEEVEDAEDEDAEVEVEIRSKPQISKKEGPTTNVSKNKKKSKGKRKGKSTTSAEEESVDELLERLALQNEASVSNSDSVTAADVDDPFEILGVDLRYLRAEDELRRIFGSKVINDAERGADGSLAGKKRQVHQRGPVSFKKTLLVTAHDHWPRPEGGLSMECVETKEGLSYFRYAFSSSYQDLQKRYEECSASHDPNTIVMMVNQHPYHVDSLLTLAELYRHMGEIQRSTDLLERALFALEYAWHPWFNVATGRCRLDFGWDPNKAMFGALFKHMQHLDRRGCHRTALEVCKLLLSLDADDPMGSLFCIDYFAVRADQFQWLRRFVHEFGADRSLALLPSFSLSLALAQFHIENQGSTSISARKRSGKASSVPRRPEASSLGEEESSTELLQQALMLHPAVLKKIVEKTPIKEDAAWAKILKHRLFDRVASGSPTLEHLTNIYVARNYLVWKAPDVQEWLLEGAQAVVGIADDRNGGMEIANWACVRKEAFPADENHYRHLLVSDFSDSTPTLPPEELQQFFAGNGPVGAAAIAEPGGVQGRQLGDRNTFLLFFQSFLPWFNHGVDVHGLDPRLEG